MTPARRAPARPGQRPLLRSITAGIHHCGHSAPKTTTGTASQLRAVGVWIEAKSRAELGKADIALFDLKCADLYRAAARRIPDATTASTWWPIFVSNEPASPPVRQLCMSLGIVLCDPQRIPLPVLLRAAANPEADMHLPETMLAEAVRPFERPCQPMQKRWQVNHDGRSIVLTLDGEPDAATNADALYVQDELTEDLLDYFELEAPGRLESRASELLLRLDHRARTSA